MTTHVTGWDLQRAGELQQSRAAFEARPDYPELLQEAASRGFRRITLSEQMERASAGAYNWRGGVWVRLTGPNQGG